jgi:hypothetical protein
MSAAPAKPSADEAPAAVPQTTPTAIGYGHPEYQFVQAVMEMQKSIGEVKASIDSLRTVVDSTKSKVDDLVNWKHKIIGGAAVLGVIVTLVGFFIGKFWEYVTIKPPAPQAQTETSPRTQPPVPPTTPPAK